MQKFTLTAVIALLILSLLPQAGEAADTAETKESLASIRYWRAGLVINGEDRKGVQQVYAGDTITAGSDPRALVKVVYNDSTGVSLWRNGVMTVKATHLQMQRGRITSDVVLGAMHLQGVMSPIGWIGLTGATFDFSFQDDSATLKVIAGDARLSLAEDASLMLGAETQVALSNIKGADATLTVLLGDVRLVGSETRTLTKGDVASVRLNPKQSPQVVAITPTPRIAPQVDAEGDNASGDTPAGPAMLPQDHPYQVALRDYLGTLKATDFEHGVTEPFTLVIPDDPEQAYRHWLLSTSIQPLIGRKRGYPVVNAPAWHFELSHIEGGEKIMMPFIWPAPSAWLAVWDYEGSPYRGKKASDALKRRALVHAAVSMMMMDHQLETSPELGGARPDWFAGQLIRFSYPFRYAKDVLPATARAAYEAGLKKLTLRVLDWGVKGEEANMDFVAAAALWQASAALEDPAITAKVQAYIRRLVTDPQHIHPAGYIVDRGGPDVGFGGMAGYALIQIAADSGWPFAKQAVDRWYRLRSHLVLPEPDGSFDGPTHFNLRLGQTAQIGQWDWGYREYVGATMTDHALWQVKIPDEEEIAEGLKSQVSHFNASVAENPQARDAEGKIYFVKSEDLKPYPWAFAMWPSWNYPITTHYGYDLWKSGDYARLLAAQKADSPMLKSPYLRGESFIRDFGKAFTAARMPDYAAILHHGPIGRDVPDSGLFHFAGPYGLGGGQLSAFWTTATGSVIFGRRAGMHWDGSFDKLDAWRTWPIHAVSGATHEGKMFTSARIVDPRVESSLTDYADADAEVDAAEGAVVQVAGVIPREILDQGKTLEGRFDFARVFTLDSEGIHVQTTVASTGQDKLAELYETIPVFLRDLSTQRKQTPSTIAFQTADGAFTPADATWRDDVTAVRIERFTGAVIIAFDSPQRVALSPEDWADTRITRAACRNIMIDLLRGRTPNVFSKATVGYRILPAGGSE